MVVVVSCYWCASALDSTNRSEEHIIPKSIGGRLASVDLLCRTCNGRFGHKIDHVLADRCSYWMTLFGIRPPGGEIPATPVTTKSGKELSLLPDGTFFRKNPKIERIGKGVFRISGAGSRAVIDRIAKQMGKRKPVRLEDFQRSFTDEGRYHYTVNLDDDARRAITKIGIGYWIHVGGDPILVDAVRGFLNGRGDAGTSARLFYPTVDAVIGRTAQVAHVLGVRADPAAGVAIVYVELFSVVRYTCVLTRNYSGPTIDASYVYDLLGLQRLPWGVWLCGIEYLLGEIERGEMFNQERFQEAVDALTAIASSRGKVG